MSHVNRVEILDALCNLLENFPAQNLRNPSLRIKVLDVLMQRDSIDILSQKVDLLGSVNYFNQLYHVRMINFF